MDITEELVRRITRLEKQFAELDTFEPANVLSLLNVGTATGAATGEIRTQNLISVSPGSGYADNLYYSGGWKYMANGYGFYVKESANGIEFYTAPNNVSGAGAAATLTLRGIIGPTGYVYTGSGQFDTGLIVQASSHATSERAAILFGDQWLVGQDASGNGTKDFFIFHALTSYSPLRITVGDSVAIGKASLATNATTGFIYIPAVAGTPTGTPETITGMAPMCYDTTNNRLYIYSGGWKSVLFA